MMGTVWLTVITGVLVFLIGEMLLRVMIEPVRELRKLIGEIAHSLGYYANQIYGAGTEESKAKQVYRDQACKLRGILETIPAPFYYCAEKLRVVKASYDLIALSNYDATQRLDTPVDKRDEIEKSLGIRRY